MNQLACSSIVLAIAACGGGESSAPDAVDALNAIDARVVDAADIVIDAPPEPKPTFIVSGFTTGQLAVDDVGLRETFKVGTQTALSHINLSLTETGAAASCTFAIFPKLVSFGVGSPSNRTFKTVEYDVALSTVIADECGWDDAYVLAEVKNQYGLAEVGWARARFDDARPNLDVFLDAEKTFPGNSDSIVRAGGGAGFVMAEDGTVDQTMRVEPPGGTLERAIYEW